MAFTFPNSTNTRLSKAYSGLAYPFTMACWGMISSNPSSYRVLMSVHNTVSNNNYISMYVYRATNNYLLLSIMTSGSQTYAQSTNTININEPFHAVGVCAGNTTRYVYLNGTYTNGLTASRVMPSITEYGVGYNYNGAYYNPMHGPISYPTLWNVALTQQEILALYCGINPLNIRPNNIVMCHPLYENGIDIVGHYHLNFTGTANWSGDIVPTTLTSSSKIILLRDY
jgi:hypothetical protein